MDHMDHANMMDQVGAATMDPSTAAAATGGVMDHMTGADNGMMSQAMDHSAMKMYFHFSSHATILFAGWVTTTAGQMFGSCALMVLIAALYEGLKALRDWLLRRATESTAAVNNHVGANRATATATKNGGGGEGGNTKMNDLSSAAATAAPSDDSVDQQQHRPAVSSLQLARRQMLSLAHVVQTLLHIVQVAVSYALMLVFMTFNAWLCLSILAGAGLGYFLFGWWRSSTSTVLDANEHCH